MDTYYAYKWIPWQLFCSKTVVVITSNCLATVTGMSSKALSFSATVAIDALWWTAASQKAGIYLRSIPNLDINSDIRFGIELYLAAGTVTAGDTLNLALKYAVVTGGPGGTDLASTPTLTATTVPAVTVGSSPSLWPGRMFTLAGTDMVIPARTLTSSSQSLYVEVSTTASPGTLVTGSRLAAFVGLGMYYTSLAAVN